MESLLQKLVNLNENIIANQKKQYTALVNIYALAGSEDFELNALLQQVVDLLTPAPPPTPGPAVSFLDNGTAVATISGIVDASGLATTFEAGSTAVWVCETAPGAGQDPNIVLTPAVDANGLPTGCGIAPGTPPALVSGDTLTCTVTQPTTGAMTPETYNPVNVVAGPASTFVITVQ
jgi:hypothetical protein